MFRNKTIYSVTAWKIKVKLFQAGHREWESTLCYFMVLRFENISPLNNCSAEEKAQSVVRNWNDKKKSIKCENILTPNL